ncbi:MAG: response regulator transcription factor [Acidobacteriota bacterium]|nr:response regulator transcription factor [Acidobacteriota bacterium]
MQSPRPKLRLLLADDHPDVLEEIRTLLAVEFDVIGTVGDGAGLVEAARTLSPDIVVTDLNMPSLNGIEAARRVLDLDLCRAVVVLTVHKDSELARTALDAGIRGYVLKENAGEELIGAVKAAADGRIYVSAAVAR